MSEFCFILNPVAGKGATGKLLRSLKDILHQHRLDHTIHETERRGHATDIARGADARVVVAVGGDGTVNEVANGLAGTGKTLGIVATGSGNDLVKSVDVPTRIEDAVSTLVDGHVKRIDIGTISCSTEGTPDPESGNSSPRLFVNGVGVGFDAAVAVRTQQIRHLRGVALYLMAVFQTLGKYRAPEFDVHIDTFHRISRNLLMAIGNGRCAGGGFYLTPDATIDDGLLDVCIVDNIPVRRLLQLLPMAMKGKHKGQPEATFVRGTHVDIKASHPVFVHADGEIVGHGVTRILISLLPQALPLLVRAQ